MSNAITIVADHREIVTLRDILPEAAGLRVLFVARTPTPASVEAGHYFQGRQGKMFWNRLRNAGLLTATTAFEDDSLLSHGYGLIDLAKIPREHGQEPSREEYAAGAERILELIGRHRPKIVVFVYKKVLDKITAVRFGIQKKSRYGFNPWLETFFGARVFVFPLPGTPCNTVDAASAMQDLVIACQQGSAAAELNLVS
ncbi:MAG: uracil-DNA glycosylase family protein [Terriglobales bacterium]